MKKTYSYYALNRKGKYEPYTGHFNSFEAAKKWFNTHGQWLIQNLGKKLQLNITDKWHR